MFFQHAARKRPASRRAEDAKTTSGSRVPSLAQLSRQQQHQVTAGPVVQTTGANLRSPLTPLTGRAVSAAERSRPNRTPATWLAMLLPPSKTVQPDTAVASAIPLCPLCSCGVVICDEVSLVVSKTRVDLNLSGID